jgi:hypothetical protein
MTSKPQKDKDRKWETHIYLTESDHKMVEQIAKEECRSVNGQILHFIKRGLSTYDGKK